ncbi:hypothetical protein H6G14_29905 [Nostoc parmelioides FACHB-3921]|uniref:Uncharacterized protein n=1 Tax=Nostoc parmelioides FACHB-3921 TaxID=2692909 RepID=A0ABR8BR69_9NOSO|nr:hypothetical protein [Nostoc parmelioides FACHB-3921]
MIPTKKVEFGTDLNGTKKSYKGYGIKLTGLVLTVIISPNTMIPKIVQRPETPLTAGIFMPSISTGSIF